VARYVVLSHLTKEGTRELHERFQNDGALAADVTAAGGRVLEQWATLGEYDFCSVVDLPNNAAAQIVNRAIGGSRGALRSVMPAIDLPLFVRLVGQTTETVGPHRWQVLWPARLARTLAHPWVWGRWARQYFRPLTVDGRERVAELRGPAIFIGNHASHFDQFAFIQAVPRRYRSNLYWGSAADRWYLKGRREYYKQGWYRSLVFGSFPIHRGGGSKTLDHAKWLIDRGGSIGIFPEGTRTTTGKLGKFKPGAALLALEKNIPVVPIYMHGLRDILAKDSKAMRPGPVHVIVGDPLRFTPGTDPLHATRVMREAMEMLREEARKLRHERKRAPDAR
jgi:1-acyl-sn-glycerol-3-phosphate acyltransferase